MLLKIYTSKTRTVYLFTTYRITLRCKIRGDWKTVFITCLFCYNTLQDAIIIRNVDFLVVRRVPNKKLKLMFIHSMHSINTLRITWNTGWDWKNRQNIWFQHNSIQNNLILLLKAFLTIICIYQWIGSAFSLVR